MHDHYSSPTRRPDVLQMVNKIIRWMVLIIWPRTVTASEKRVGQDQSCNRLPTSVTSGARVFTVSSPPSDSYPLSSNWSPHVPSCSTHLCKCAVWVHLRGTRNWTFILPRLGQRRGDGDHGHHRGCIEVRRVWPERANCSKKVQWCVFRIPDQCSANRQPEVFSSHLSSFC